MSTPGHAARHCAGEQIGDNPYRASAVHSAAAPRRPARTVRLMAATGGLLGILQLGAGLWAWHADAISAPAVLWFMLFNAALYFVLAYGSYRRSRLCAALLLVYAELHTMLVVWLLSPLPAYALLAPLVLLLILVTGTLAIFRDHRRR